MGVKRAWENIDLVVQCSDGHCIPLVHVCDEFKDCLDGSDEHECGGGCTFKCSTGGECYSESDLCDGQAKCPAGDDEQNCPNHSNSCFGNAFLCAASEECIPQSWRCDNIIDCADQRYAPTYINAQGHVPHATFSDEADCTHGTHCTDNMFQCSKTKCISKVMVCDGVPGRVP